MHYLMEHIDRYLMACRELTAFCAQNGWIDNKTLDYEILEQNDRYVLAFVQFDEILMEGGGSIASRIPHQGRLRLTLDRYGQVARTELL